MNQNDVNAAWRQTLPGRGEIPGITILSAPHPRRGVSGLRKPYEYCVPRPTLLKLTKTLREIMKRHEHMLQCQLIEVKSLAFGQRINVFALAYRPGFCGPTVLHRPSGVNVGDGRGIMKADWEQFWREVIHTLRLALGPDVTAYIEPWEADRKFQFRFCTYIMFRELE